jgi:two-component system nitrate/nitrite response regulator NarL
MAKRVATVIIEPRQVLREALELLMGNHSYRVISGLGSVADIVDSSLTAEGPKLVILGTQSIDDAVVGAFELRRLWPGCKIILLFDGAGIADFPKLLMSHVDGCVPLFVSPETLVNVLDLIVTRHVRVLVMGGTSYRTNMTALEDQAEPQPQNGIASGQTPLELMTDVRPTARPDAPLNYLPSAIVAAKAVLQPCETGAQTAQSAERVPKLSDREVQILDGLVQGHSNKVIARLCDITEATVKVHMKSILRKIQVDNRTQAAVWALEHREVPRHFRIKPDGGSGSGAENASAVDKLARPCNGISD